MDTGSDLATIRLNLAEAEANLRTAEDYLSTVRLKSDIRLIEVTGGDPKVLGTNEGDRKRAYEAAREQDEDCRIALDNYRKLQKIVALLQAERDNALDARRAHEWAIREAMVHMHGTSDALEVFSRG